MQHVKETGEFAFEALRDSRDTIRALDFKANALLVVLAIVGTSFDKIATAESYMASHTSGLATTAFWLAGALGAASWTISLAAACLVLAGKYNPANHIRDANSATGAFYLPAAFPMSAWVFPLWPQVQATSLEQHIAALPSTEAEIRREACFEHLKLAYIRETKSVRIRVAFLFGFVGLVLLCAIWTTAALSGMNARP